MIIFAKSSTIFMFSAILSLHSAPYFSSAKVTSEIQQFCNPTFFNCSFRPYFPLRKKIQIFVSKRNFSIPQNASLVRLKVRLSLTQVAWRKYTTLNVRFCRCLIFKYIKYVFCIILIYSTLQNISNMHIFRH